MDGPIDFNLTETAPRMDDNTGGFLMHSLAKWFS